jgi:hypothetical protein
VKANPVHPGRRAVQRAHALIKATERFNTVLTKHARAVEAARVISEGLVQTIAGEVAGSSAPWAPATAPPVGPPAGDGRAITLNRSA